MRGIRQVDLLAHPEALQRGAVVHAHDLLVAIAAEVSGEHGGDRLETGDAAQAIRSRGGAG